MSVALTAGTMLGHFVAAVQSVQQPGTLLRDPTDLAPEEIQAGLVTGASDQYALGLIAYERLTGRHPFAGQTGLAPAVAQVREPPPSPRAFNPNLPPAAERALLAALAKQPQDRHPTVSAFVDAIARADPETA
jgi:serine/threonine-protein kinase